MQYSLIATRRSTFPIEISVRRCQRSMSAMNGLNADMDRFIILVRRSIVAMNRPTAGVERIGNPTAPSTVYEPSSKGVNLGLGPRNP